MRSQFVLVLAMLVVPVVSAQESKVLEDKHKAATSSARQNASRAYKLIEVYGRSQKTVKTADRLRKLAWQRLLGQLQRESTDTEDRRPLADVQAELKKYRSAVIARLAQLDPDRYSVKEEVEKAQSPLIHKSYDVSDLIFQAPDHETGNMGLGAGIDLGGAAMHFGADTDEFSYNLRLDSDSLFEFVSAQTVEDSDGQIDFSKGQITASQPAEVHQKIVKLLSMLRKQRGRLIRIEVQALKMTPAQFVKFSSQVSLSKTQEEEIEGLIQSGEIIRQFKESAIAYDGQKISLRKGATVAAVTDIEVNQTGVVPVLNPVVVSIQEGLLAEFRPHYNISDGLVEIEMSLSLSELNKNNEKRKVYSGRINNVVAGADKSPGYEFELPKMKLSRQTATAVVPVNKGAIVTGVASRDDGEEVATAIYINVTIVDNKN